MMLSCRDTTRLASEALDQPLSWWQRLQVAMHLMMCGPCRRARRLMRLLRDAAARLGQEDFSQLASDQSLTPQMRQRIKDALRQEPPAAEKDEKSV